MCKKTVFRNKAFISLLLGICILSGCKQADNIKIGDNFFSQNTNDNEKKDDNNEPSEILPASPKHSPNTDTTEIYYYSEDAIDLSSALHRCVSDGENIYLAHGEPDLYVMPIGTDTHSPANIDNPEGLDVCNIALDAYGRLHLLMASRNNEKWLIWRLDENYQVDKSIDISAYLEQKQIPLWFLIDKNGTYYLQWIMERNGLIIDSEGTLKHRFTPELLGVKWTYEAAAGKDGQIYLVYGSQDTKLEIGRLDLERCLIQNNECHASRSLLMLNENPSLSFPGGEVFNAMSSGTDTNLLLFSPYSGVWAYDHESGILENRVALSDIGFDADAEFWPLAFLPDGRLLLLGHIENNEHAEAINERSSDCLLLKYIPIEK